MGNISGSTLGCYYKTSLMLSPACLPSSFYNVFGDCLLDSNAASLFENNWLNRQIVSDDKIQITLLILGRSALYVYTCKCSINIKHLKLGDSHLHTQIQTRNMLRRLLSRNIIFLSYFDMFWKSSTNWWVWYYRKWGLSGKMRTIYGLFWDISKIKTCRGIQAIFNLRRSAVALYR